MRVSHRRSFLRTLGVAVTTTLAGCKSTADSPPEPGVDELPKPDQHIYGANGEWSSFGCNASNTRTVADGKAPTTGVAERWRVEVSPATFHEPIVSGGRVYQADNGLLHVYDTVDGTELWGKTGVQTTPLVRGGMVYVGIDDRLVALDSETGKRLWKQVLSKNKSVQTPATDGGKWLYVPAGETIYRIQSQTGNVNWSRRLFGRILGPPVIYNGYAIALLTEAGKMYLLGKEGGGGGEWTLPSRPRVPPTADTDGIYTNCLNGSTYGISLERRSQFTIDWRVETGWANGGLAIEQYLYATGTDGLHAINPETGEHKWQVETGQGERTAPALCRDTLFVGGDRLSAIDPTPNSGYFDVGPVTRFEKSFHGRVGPGPVLNDGVLYTIAKTGPSNTHLLALE
jgi:outer membrane protein assembly factor BamB